jgi:exosortase B
MQAAAGSLAGNAGVGPERMPGGRTGGPARFPAAGATTWWPILAGMLVLYVPTFYGLATGMWGNADYAHGPIILALSLFLLARRWKQMAHAAEGRKASALGWPIGIAGLLFYVVGRSQNFPLLEISSFVIVLAAALLLVFGRAGLRLQWFALFFMLFMVPLPGEIVATLTLPMKIAVSYVVEHVLYAIGYPIARSGVILQIGHYQLMVVDACAGLQTLLTLEALGLFYLNLVRHPSAARNIVLGILIVPVSFFSNVVRVLALTLITYHFGDEAGQGFLHGFAGLVLFVTALLSILALDGLLQTGLKLWQTRISTRIPTRMPTRLDSEEKSA